MLPRWVLGRAGSEIPRLKCGIVRWSTLNIGLYRSWGKTGLDGLILAKMKILKGVAQLKPGSSLASKGS